MVCMYSHWVEHPHVEGPQLQQLPKYLKKAFSCWKNPVTASQQLGSPLYKTNSTPDMKMVADIAAFPLADHSQSCGFVEPTNEVVKTQLVEAFNLSWPKALPLILLNWRSIPFGKHRLSPFKTIIRKIVRLD